MSNPIETVVREREREEELGRELGGDGPGSDRSSDTRGFQVPAEGRSDEVRCAEDVEGAGKDAACDSVGDGAEPGYLGLVDA